MRILFVVKQIALYVDLKLKKSLINSINKKPLNRSFHVVVEHLDFHQYPALEFHLFLSPFQDSLNIVFIDYHK